ncbi:ROK family protein [Actinobacteria bacterium YIM 96077]|uniref:ROK family protein n=1 Tax=Phytoactinopolyspora halophila TaxID=1981511 RepID=A0A329R3U9_9ACTN|nr:ROK family protein [Phytoactinopolyspora halophila]AYY13231.1 ROK family protein [Actinobacteria bacterium YIM 96077]RAW17688.1 ROK family protein [Phytoactinopolyspora halophila]
MGRVLATGSGVVLDLIRSGQATTRTDLVDHLGWSRITLSRRLNELLDASIIVSAGQLSSRGGRPPEEFAVHKDAGLLLAIDIGSSHTRLGLTDLVSTVLIEDEADIGFPEGPERIVEWVTQVVDYMLEQLGTTRADVHGIGLGVPAPVDTATGHITTPDVEPVWKGVVLPDLFTGEFPAVCAAERDVNIMALAESRLGWPDYRHLVVLKAGVGVSCGLILDGRIYRGWQGGAGELSRPAPPDGRQRRVEYVASGGTIRRELLSRGHSVRTSADIVSLASAGNDDALELLADAGYTIGDTLIGVVAALNPQALVVGGNLAEAGDPFVIAVREAVRAGVPDVAGAGLVVEQARLGDKAGVIGASLIAQDALFDPDRISRITRDAR